MEARFIILPVEIEDGFIVDSPERYDSLMIQLGEIASRAKQHYPDKIIWVTYPLEDLSK